ncbi:hypothetical protein ACOBQB_01205 [Streptomyces sp. G5(2025)]|uniref:hypothetical protein n=1 Tax=Streptomyces sp. G5(2025) TaxID=3406628 RepID=UPI003C1B286F
MADISDELVKLEHSAETERAKLAGLEDEEYAAQWRHWNDATERFRAAVTAHAAATGQSRNEVEQAAKKAARRAEEDPVE